ncbi:hypothetical protein MTBLM5_430020 [Magnetospirillum sp. LM-5]|uniref:hypothetical protein n=1 Tax=Magnetospirillum sp. LM-5 TaxID=2681466 RepID=UPI001381AE2E|nr:hypothetical protein [Magnetospirillum sp. LM-5]CAA7622080.1 hypothetical protein MTBLM5_430020 [Magnetospirillum sp. LM-5]
MTDDAILKAQARLACNSSHALGNMLTVVAGNLDLVADDIDQGRAVDGQLVARAQAATRRAADLLAGLRVFYGTAQILADTDLARWWLDLGRDLDKGLLAGRVSSWTGPAGETMARIAADDLARAVRTVASLSGDSGTMGGELTLIDGHLMQVTLHLAGLELKVEPECSPLEPFAWGERHAIGLSAAWGAAQRAGGTIRVDGAGTTTLVVQLVLPLATDRAARLP